MDLDEIEKLPVLDEVSTRSMRMFLGDEFNVIMDEFKTSTPPLLATLRMVVESGRIEEVVDIAHRLKSGSGNLGLSAFSGICQYLEEGLRDGQEIDVEQTIDVIERQFERILNI